MSFDARTDGTPATEWDVAAESATPAVLTGDGLLVIAAHPDDETLGAGGLIGEFAQRGLPITVVVVTDGSPGGDEAVTRVRIRELHAALELLAPSCDVIELGFPDGATREHRDAIRDRLAEIVDAAPGSPLIVAPWAGDGHRDHRVVGELAAEVRGARTLWAYPIWMWHWGDPQTTDVGAWVSVSIDAARKQRAVDAFASQTTGSEPMLRPSFLRHFERAREIFVTVQP